MEGLTPSKIVGVSRYYIFLKIFIEMFITVECSVETRLRYFNIHFIVAFYSILVFIFNYIL